MGLLVTVVPGTCCVCPGRCSGCCWKFSSLWVMLASLVWAEADGRLQERFLAEPGKAARSSGCSVSVSHPISLLGPGRLQRAPRLVDFVATGSDSGSAALGSGCAARSGQACPRAPFPGRPAAVGLGFVCLWLPGSWRGHIGHSWVASSGPRVNTLRMTHGGMKSLVVEVSGQLCS